MFNGEPRLSYTRHGIACWCKASASVSPESPAPMMATSSLGGDIAEQDSDGTAEDVLCYIRAKDGGNENS